MHYRVYTLRWEWCSKRLASQYGWLRMQFPTPMCGDTIYSVLISIHIHSVHTDLLTKSRLLMGSTSSFYPSIRNIFAVHRPLDIPFFVRSNYLSISIIIIIVERAFRITISTAITWWLRGPGHTMDMRRRYCNIMAQNINWLFTRRIRCSSHTHTHRPTHGHTNII